MSNYQNVSFLLDDDNMNLLLHPLQYQKHRLSAWLNWKGRDKLTRARQSSVPKGWAISLSPELRNVATG